VYVITPGYLGVGVAESVVSLVSFLWKVLPGWHIWDKLLLTHDQQLMSAVMNASDVKPKCR